jgi:integrase/recombinase XerD
MIDGRISPLRQRMIEDMNVRHFAANTQETYIRAVEKLSRFLDRSPATPTSPTRLDFCDFRLGFGG